MEHSIKTVKFNLWHIEKVGLRRMEQSVLALQQVRAVDQLLPLLQEVIQASQIERGIILYLQLLDHLLNHPLFNHLLHSCLIELYPSIVRYLQRQGHTEEVEHARMLRKLWKGKLHPALYLDLRTVTLSRARVDIDLLTNSDAI